MSTETEASLSQAILKTWPSSGDRPRYVAAFQVCNGAGFAWGRKLDAVVLDTWPSGGHFIHGLEVKCSAGDLRRELQDTTKSADFLPLLDHFSIVAPAGMVKMEMLPASWGLYCPDGNGGLRAKRKPLMLHDGTQTETVRRSFMAAFARALVDRTDVRTVREEAYQRGHTAGLAAGQINLDRETDARKSLETAVAGFESESGVRIGRYDHGEVGKAVAFVLRGGLERQFGQASQLHKLAADLEGLAAQFDELHQKMTREGETT